MNADKVNEYRRRVKRCTTCKNIKWNSTPMNWYSQCEAKRIKIEDPEAKVKCELYDAELVEDDNDERKDIEHD